MSFSKPFKPFKKKPIHPINPMIRLKNNIFWKIDPYETVANATESTQNLSPGRFWHAEVEFDVKNLRFRHPDLEMKENHL